MTPREKAEELINKFSKNLPWYNEKDNKYKSKQCAIIAVDEIINLLGGNRFWQSVKEEIQKM